jgi:hypothetical protein
VQRLLLPFHVIKSKAYVAFIFTGDHMVESRPQHVGCVEHFARPIAVVPTMMAIVSAFALGADADAVAPPIARCTQFWAIDIVDKADKATAAAMAASGDGPRF